MKAGMSATIHRTRRLGRARLMTGKERRWINPNKGLLKILERNLDMVVSRFLYPHLSRVWNPYSWLLEKRFVLTETSVSPAGWPRRLDPLRVLLISDIHTGIFLKPQTLADLMLSLMERKPDLVTIAGDIVTGHSSEVRPFLDALAPLSRAPLGATEELRTDLSSIGITTLKNESVTLAHGRGQCVLGAIDDLIFGRSDWERLFSEHGVPHLLLAHNPDHFYEAQGHGVPLTLSGHTHGGQIRFPNGPPLIRHSRFCLDEGLFAFRSSLLVVTRGLGSVGLRWRRAGAQSIEWPVFHACHGYREKGPRKSVCRACKGTGTTFPGSWWRLRKAWKRFWIS